MRYGSAGGADDGIENGAAILAEAPPMTTSWTIPIAGPGGATN